MRNLRAGHETSSDAVLLMFIKLVTMVLGLVVTRLLSEYLSVHDYGTYSQILLVVTTVANFTILGMMDGVNYFYNRETDVSKRETYIATIFTVQCGVSTVAGTVVLCLTKPLCAYFENPDVAGLMMFAAVLPLLQNLLGMFQILLVAVGKARILAIRNLLVSLARLGVVMLVVWTIQNVSVIFFVTMLLDLTQILLFIWILRKSNCRIRLAKTDFHIFGEIFSYCAPMAVFIVVSGLNRDLDKYLIALMTDTETLAVYSNASKKLPFDILVSSFCTVLIPQMTKRITQGEYGEASALYKSFLEIGYISTGILCCTALSVSPQLMQLLYSEKYLGGLNVFCIYILVDMLLFTNITLILSAAGKTKILMALGAGSLVLNGLLNTALYRLMGIPGPAIATLLVTALNGILMLKLGARELCCQVCGLFDVPKLLVFAGEMTALLLLATVIRKWLERQMDSYFFVLVIVGVFCGVSMLVLQGKQLIGALKSVNQITK